MVPGVASHGRFSTLFTLKPRKLDSWRAVSPASEQGQQSRVSRVVSVWSWRRVCPIADPGWVAALCGWSEVSGSNQNVQIGGIGDPCLAFEAEQLGFGSGAFESDLDGGRGDAEAAACLFELEGFGWRVERWPREGRLKDDL
jgi:hypothetical protein